MRARARLRLSGGTFVFCVDGERYQNGRRPVPVNDRPSLSGRTRQTQLLVHPLSFPFFFLFFLFSLNRYLMDRLDFFRPLFVSLLHNLIEKEGEGEERTEPLAVSQSPAGRLPRSISSPGQPQI